MTSQEEEPHICEPNSVMVMALIHEVRCPGPSPLSQKENLNYIFHLTTKPWARYDPEHVSFEASPLYNQELNTVYVGSGGKQATGSESQ